MYSGGIITGSVSDANLCAALSIGPGTLANIITRGSVAQWAKYKAEYYATLGRLSNAQRKNNLYSIVNIPHYSRVADMVSDVRADNAYYNATNRADFDLHYDFWGYRRPVGGTSSPFRRGDFVGDNNGSEGYNRYAQSPVTVADASQYERRFSTGAITIGWNGYYNYTDGNNIFLKDFKILTTDFANCYMCLCLYNASTQYYLTMPDADNISVAERISDIGPVRVRFGANNVPVGTWHTFLFVSDYPIPFGQTFSTYGNYFPLGFTRCDLTVTQGVPHVTITAFACWFLTNLKREIDGDFVIQNTDAEPYGISDVKVEYFNSSDSLLYTSTVMVRRTIAANSSVSGSFSEPQSVVTAQGLRNATRARLYFTVENAVTVQQYTDITIGPPRTMTL